MERLFRSPFEDCSSLALPPQLPVMVLSECFLFPGCALPLFIFEQRYRDMLSMALSTHRMFCIGTRSDAEDDGVLPVSTAGVVRECITHPDGTSHLVLFGVKRIRLTGWVQEKPFRIAKVEPQVPAQACPEKLATMLKETLKTLPSALPAEVHEALKRFCDKLGGVNCPQLACDLLTYHFVQCPLVLEASLREPCPIKRFEILLKALHDCDE